MFRKLWDMLLGRKPAETGARPQPNDTAEPYLPGYTDVSAPSPDPFSPLYNPQYLGGMEEQGDADSNDTDSGSGGDSGGD
jgi:hypothetical protein